MPEYDKQRAALERFEGQIITRVFSRLEAQYGHSWRSLFDSDPKQNRMRKREWALNLHPFPVKVIKGVVDALPKLSPDFPPTMGQFVAYCEERMRPKAEEYKPLPKPGVRTEAQKEAARLAYEEAKRILGR